MREIKMAVKWKFRNGKWRRINVEFQEQKDKTLMLTTIIRAIYDKDVKMSPGDQQKTIEALPGMTRSEMKKIVAEYHSNRMNLAANIRAIISKNRATD